MSLRLSEASIKSRHQTFFNRIYNKEDKTCFGRPLNGLLKLLLYILIFTIAIILLSYIMMCVFLWKFVGDSHAYYEIQNTGKIDPGASFVPNINDHSPIIWYSAKEGSKRKHEDYTKAIGKFLKPYPESQDDTDYQYYVDCDGKDTKILKPGEVCYFNKKNLKDCANPDYGYAAGKPCFYLKINKIPSWTPEYYSKKLPTSMPDSLKEAIKKNQHKEKVWIVCEGRRPSDVENLGQVAYYPTQGFRGVYFPFKSVDDYISPLVGVQLTNVTKNYLVSMHCSMWAKNFKENRLLIQVYVDLDKGDGKDKNDGSNKDKELEEDKEGP